MPCRTALVKYFRVQIEKLTAAAGRKEFTIISGKIGCDWRISFIHGMVNFVCSFLIINKKTARVLARYPEHAVQRTAGTSRDRRRFFNIIKLDNAGRQQQPNPNHCCSGKQVYGSKWIEISPYDIWSVKYKIKSGFLDSAWPNFG